MTIDVKLEDSGFEMAIPKAPKESREDLTVDKYQLEKRIQELREAKIGIRAYSHTSIDCPKCRGLMPRSLNNLHQIACLNPECGLYSILFEQPTVELKLAKVQVTNIDDLKAMRPDA